jgi:hypothetical protein
MNAIAQMAISTHMIHHSVGTIGANLAGGASGSGGHQGGRAVAPVDLRVERLHTLHLFKPILRLGGFPDLKSTVPGRTTVGTARACRRKVRSRTGSATGSIWRVQEILLGTRTILPCRHEFARLLFK